MMKTQKERNYWWHGTERNKALKPSHNKVIFCRLWQRHQGPFPKTWEGEHKRGDYADCVRASRTTGRTRGPSPGARTAMKASQCFGCSDLCTEGKTGGDLRGAGSKHPSNTR